MLMTHESEYIDGTRSSVNLLRLSFQKKNEQAINIPMDKYVYAVL
jgi:hypothetical protein